MPNPGSDHVPASTKQSPCGLDIVDGGVTLRCAALRCSARDQLTRAVRVPDPSRVERVALLLEGADDSPPARALLELLVDCRHWCEAHGTDFGEVVGRVLAEETFAPMPPCIPPHP